MGNYKFLIAGIIVVFTGISIAIFGVLTMGNFSQETYSISVDPTKEKQTLFIMARVSIQNTGTGSLTNVQINYGEGDKDYLGTLKPGQSIIVSPPQGNSLQYVIVSAEPDIYVSKVYREPIGMPGMMGS
jgi:hypothetical protein